MKEPDATVQLLNETRDVLAALPNWAATEMETALRAIADARGVGAGKLFQPLRVALTGLAVSPGIFDVLELLGRDRSLRRLDEAVARIGA
jgi:glutamyl-tRNA synthetase